MNGMIELVYLPEREVIERYQDESLDFVKGLPQETIDSIMSYKDDFELFCDFSFDESRVRYIQDPASFCSEFNMFYDQGKDLWIGVYKNKNGELRCIYDFLEEGE